MLLCPSHFQAPLSRAAPQLLLFLHQVLDLLGLTTVSRLVNQSVRIVTDFSLRGVDGLLLRELCILDHLINVIVTQVRLTTDGDGLFFIVARSLAETLTIHWHLYRRSLQSVEHCGRGRKIHELEFS